MSNRGFMNIRKDNTGTCVSPARDREFEAAVRRITAMSREEVKTNLRRLGIEPATSLPPYVYDLTVRPATRSEVDKIVEVFCALLLLSLAVYASLGYIIVILLAIGL